MRQYAHKGFRIEQLSSEAKMLYSSFLFFALAAMVVSVLYYGALVDNRPYEGAHEYYAGEVTAIAAPDAPIDDVASLGGPEMDLPDDMLAEEIETAPMMQTMTWRKLLEVTHFHLFTIPVFLLIIAHIFMLCPIRPSRKFGTIASSIVSTGVHMAAPWVIFYGGGAWSWLMPVTGAWMTLSMLVLTIWPAWAMWKPRKSAT